MTAPPAADYELRVLGLLGPLLAALPHRAAAHVPAHSLLVIEIEDDELPAVLDLLHRCGLGIEDVRQVAAASPQRSSSQDREPLSSRTAVPM
jgi:hypothetical protein